MAALASGCAIPGRRPGLHNNQQEPSAGDMAEHTFRWGCWARNFLELDGIHALPKEVGGGHLASLLAPLVLVHSAVDGQIKRELVVVHEEL